MKATVRIDKAIDTSATLNGGIKATTRLNPQMVSGVASWNGETGDVTYTPPVTSVNGQTGDVVLSADVASVNGKTGEVVLNASDVGALPDSYTAPVSSVNSKTGAVTLSASDVGALPNDTTYVGSVSVSRNLTSGTKVGTITVDGESTTLYAPTDTDTNVTQTLTNTSDYTYWRGVVIGASSSSTESGSWSTTTDGVRTFANLRYQPSTGTLKTTTFKGSLNGTASGNLKSGDNVSLLTNDAGYLTTETDPVFSASAASGITSEDITAWNGKQNALTFDNAPTEDSNNPVKSGGVFTALAGKQDAGDYAASASGDTTHTAVRAAGIPMGKCDNTSTSTAFTATVDGVTSYYNGLTILLYNGVVTSASGFTININGLGALPSYSNMTMGNPVTPTTPTRDTTIFNINYAMLISYSDIVSGGCWIMYRGYDANTNTIGYQLRTNSYTRDTVSRTRYYRILFSSADDTEWIPANTTYDNSATSVKPVNTTPINPFGEIVYLGNSTNYAAGAAVTATAIWQQYAFTLGYSFNNTGAALTLTSKKPVYVKCTPQTDGSAIIDSTTPIVQAMPTTADGKIYIFLGVAYSATAIEMTMNHPVYYYNGGIRLWTGAT